MVVLVTVLFSPPDATSPRARRPGCVGVTRTSLSGGCLSHQLVLSFRCHLPTGKTAWLCEGHQDGPRITKLSTESASRDDGRRVLHEEDVKLKELLEASHDYKKHKHAHHKKRSIVLPAKGMIVYHFVTAGGVT